MNATGAGDPHEHEQAIRDALRPGERVRIDWRNDRLRRTFRAVATVVEVREATDKERSAGSGGDPNRSDAGWTVLIELRPRFGSPTRQRIDGDTVVNVRPA